MPNDGWSANFAPKLVAMTTSLEGPNTYHLVKKIVKIGPVDPEIIGLQEIILEHGQNMHANQSINRNLFSEQ